jgi:hypothetical protein
MDKVYLVVYKQRLSALIRNQVNIQCAGNRDIGLHAYMKHALQASNELRLDKSFDRGPYQTPGANTNRDTTNIPMKRPGYQGQGQFKKPSGERPVFDPCPTCKSTTHREINCWVKYPEKQPRR